jgi:hypothetical protein
MEARRRLGERSTAKKRLISLIAISSDFQAFHHNAEKEKAPGGFSLGAF